MGPELLLSRSRGAHMAQSLEPHAKKTLLVVDDDPAILELTSGFLRDDYNVLTAVSGKEALQTMKDYKGDLSLLLSDFEMPGMSGIELATQLAAERPQLKVLLMSGFPGGTLVLNEGWHFLPKPFVPSQMRLLIKTLISPESRFSAAT
jgi:DNA-binding NtrC family response regulator